MSLPADRFESAPQRLDGELDERLQLARDALAYGVSFLDDALRAISRHDLVLLGAPSGVGKTDLATAIAAHNASTKRNVFYFALEAEPRELERRRKFAMLVEAAVLAKHPRATELSYPDWHLGYCEDICEPFNTKVDEEIGKQLATLKTYYRGMKFDQGDLRRLMLNVHDQADLIVVDHLHYVDSEREDDNENRALGETVKTIRDISLRIGKPVLLVAHLRKRDPRAKQLVATLDDFHGSSNVAKIATHAITIDRAPFDAPRWYLAPTFITISKDRRAGAPGLVALTYFDRRFRTYRPNYTLGRLMDGGTRWEPIAIGDRPRWAKNHVPTEAL